MEQSLEGLTTADPAYLPELTELAKELAESKPDTALILCAQARQLAIDQKRDSLLGQIFIAFSSANSYLARYEKSTSYAFEAIEVAEKYLDTLTLIDGFNNIGIDFLMQEEDDKAVEYFTKVEQLARISRDSLRWGHALNNLGLMQGYAENLEQELEYYDQAAAIFNAIGEREGYANTLLNSGTTYTMLGQLNLANELYERALIVFEEIEMTSGIQNTIQSIAENHLVAGKLELAEERALEALAIALQHEFKQDVIYTLSLLGDIAAAKGDYESALDFVNQSTEVKEEVFTAEKSQQIAELETKYQTEKKEQQLAIANLQIAQQKFQKYVWIGGLSLVILIAGFVLFSFRQKSILENKLLAEEVENLRLKIGSLLGQTENIKLNHQELNEKLLQPLSEREFEILNLTVSDKTNQEIADEVFLSVNTVKYHLKNVYEKLGVNNRKEALHLIIGQS